MMRRRDRGVLGRTKKSVRAHPIPLRLSIHSGGRPHAPCARPPSARANVRRPPHTSPPPAAAECTNANGSLSTQTVNTGIDFRHPCFCQRLIFNEMTYHGSISSGPLLPASKNRDRLINYPSISSVNTGAIFSYPCFCRWLIVNGMNYHSLVLGMSSGLLCWTSQFIPAVEWRRSP